MGSREGVAAKIDADTVQKIDKMNHDIVNHKNPIIEQVLGLVYVKVKFNMNN